MKNVRKILVAIGIMVCVGVIVVLVYRYIGGQTNVWLETEMFPIEMCYLEDEIYCVGKVYENDKKMYALYKMKRDDNEIEKVNNIEISKNSIIEKIASVHNDLYVIIRIKDSKERREIWKINDSEEVVAVYDITQLWDLETSKFRTFCVDENGLFYIREMNGNETILYEPISGNVKKVPDSSENVSFESMALGSDGNIYMLFCRHLSVGGGYELVKISDGESTIIYCGELLPYNDIYSVMGTGDDKYEIFFKSTNAVYGYDQEENVAKFICNIDLEEYQYTKSCFISKNYLLILGMNPIIENEKQLNRIKFLKIELVKGDQQ